MIDDFVIYSIMPLGIKTSVLNNYKMAVVSDAGTPWQTTLGDYLGRLTTLGREDPDNH